MGAAKGYITFDQVFTYIKTDHSSPSGTNFTSQEVFGTGKIVDKDGVAARDESDKATPNAANIGNYAGDLTDIPDFTETANSIDIPVAGRDQDVRIALSATLGDWQPAILVRNDNPVFTRLRNMAKKSKVTIALVMRSGTADQTAIIANATLATKTPNFPSGDAVRTLLTFTVNKLFDQWVDKA